MTHEAGALRQAINAMHEQCRVLDPSRTLDRDLRERYRKLVREYGQSLRRMMSADWAPDPELVADALAFHESAVFIGGMMKSGTSIVPQLLDGHDQCVVFPGDAHLREWLPGGAKAEEAGGIIDHCIYRFCPQEGAPQNLWFLGEDERPYLSFLQYYDYWLGRLTPSGRNAALAVMLAIYCAHPKRPARPRLWVDKTPGNELHVERLLRYFPSAKFIQIIREPHANIASMKRLANKKEWDFTARGAAYAYRDSLRAGLDARARLGEQRYHLVSYEDLVGDTEREAQKIAEYLNIDMTDSLLNPTINDSPSLANSMYKEEKQKGGVRAGDMERWRKVITVQEKRDIAAIVYPALHRIGRADNISLAEYLTALPGHFAFKLGRILVR